MTIIDKVKNIISPEPTNIIRLNDFSISADDAHDAVPCGLTPSDSGVIVVVARDLAMHTETFAEQLACLIKSKNPSFVSLVQGSDGWKKDITRQLNMLGVPT